MRPIEVITKRWGVGAAVLSAVVLLSACGSKSAVVESDPGSLAGESPVAAASSTPAATATPTPTRSATSTPTPSRTPSPTPTPDRPEPTRSPVASETPGPKKTPEPTKTPEAKPALVMLEADQIPTSKAFPSWTQTRIVDGLRSTDPYCWQKPFPRESTKLRAIYDPEIGSGGIKQLVVRMDSEDAAKKLVEEVKKCWPQKKATTNEDGAEVTSTTYGTYDVKDGVTVGAQTTCGGNEYPDDSMLWAIGRDGREVTYVHFWPMQDNCKAPKDMWIDLAKLATRQL